MVFRLKCQIFQQQRHLANFFISFKIKPDVTFIGFTNKHRIFTPFWYQNWKKCKLVLPIRIWIWMKDSWNLLMWARSSKKPLQLKVFKVFFHFSSFYFFSLDMIKLGHQLLSLRFFNGFNSMWQFFFGSVDNFDRSDRSDHNMI